jgi:hypothetical protein
VNNGAGLDHQQACPYCDKYVAGGCTIYPFTEWINARGGCPHFPYRELPIGLTYVDGVIHGKGRVGQQKQKHQDRAYASKWDRKGKY